MLKWSSNVKTKYQNLLKREETRVSPRTVWKYHRVIRDHKPSERFQWSIWQIMVHKTLHRKIKLGQHQSHHKPAWPHDMCLAMVNSSSYTCGTRHVNDTRSSDTGIALDTSICQWVQINKTWTLHKTNGSKNKPNIGFSWKS